MNPEKLIIEDWEDDDYEDYGDEDECLGCGARTALGESHSPECPDA